MSLLYDFVLLFLSIASLVKHFVKIRARGWFFIQSKLGLNLNEIKLENRKRVWIHAVSLGEIKACISLFDKYSKLGYQILVSTSTDTAYSWGKKRGGIEIFYLPIDFSFLMKRTINMLKVDKMIVVESDVWPQMLACAKKNGAHCYFLSAKISQTSFRRLKYLKSFAKWLYKDFDAIIAQNALYEKRFRQLGLGVDRVSLGKNLKFANLESHVMLQEIRLNKRKGVIMLSCTHEGEEEMLIRHLNNLIGVYTFIIAPRHPDRFNKVRELLVQHSVQSSSQKGYLKAPCILVDEMGVLDDYYHVSDCIVMGGSFIDGIGGHNLLEPLKHKKTLFYGPFMQNQMDIAAHANISGNCYQISADTLKSSIVKVFTQKSLQ